VCVSVSVYLVRVCIYMLIYGQSVCVCVCVYLVNVCVYIYDQCVSVGVGVCFWSVYVHIWSVSLSLPLSLSYFGIFVVCYCRSIVVA